LQILDIVSKDIKMERTNPQQLNYQRAIFEKIYDSNVTYQQGEFNVQKSEGEYSSAPVRPKTPIPHKALIVSSGEFIEERLLISEVDRREKIKEATRYPYSIHTQIESVFNGSLYGGTGAMVGPHHLLTCGHNVYSEGEWAQKITVYPGREGKMAPYGEARVTRAYLLKSWTEERKKESDIALLVLNRSVGLLTGWGGMVSPLNSSLQGRTFHITGYPGDKNFVEMWGTSNKIAKVFDETFSYDIDTMGGQSGSSIWSKDFGNPMILGVHTLGSNSVNYGVRISNSKFKEFLEPMISQTYEIIENLPPQNTSNPKEAFGAEQWATYFGDVGEVPALPSNIEDILNSYCPYTGKKVRESHLLTLIPATVGGKALTLSKLGELIKSPIKGCSIKYSAFDVGEHDKAVNSSYWALITKDVIPNSRNKTYAEQKNLLKQNYKVPKAIEAAVSVLMHHAQGGERLYSDSPSYTYTRCEEAMGLYRVFVGGFGSGGLAVDRDCDGYLVGGDGDGNLGLGALRKF
jgi:V8-like Glu-specific endopeptidase